MTIKGTYDSQASLDLNISTLLQIYRDLGASKVYVKKLAPNDNSKNQPYFGAHLTELSFLPTGNIEASATKSAKTSNRKIKYQVEFPLSWVDCEGTTYPAPKSKLIYYPQYPEVRFSGFLLGSKVEMSEWMNPQRSGRAEGRWLILGVTKERTYGFLALPYSQITSYLESTDLITFTNIFSLLQTNHLGSVDNKQLLLAKLKEIHDMGWVQSQRRNSDMNIIPYQAQNGGGYTLESLLEISPNGIAEPDYLGWEIKQYGVTKFPSTGSKPTTLMTPEPDGGQYKTEGALAFMQKYGYPPKNGTPDRLNFSGKHCVNKLNTTTQLTLVLDGYDIDKKEIVDSDGNISLLDSNGDIAASWSFSKIMEHWKKKHSKTAFVPALKRLHRGEFQYLFGDTVKLGEGTSFKMLLDGLASGATYYDPGINVKNISKRPTIKKRSQFRINHSNLSALYHSFKIIQV
ncbi:MAG: hypothetical protein HWE16_13385 [Gammaproteobacteria bacterium]|nr:hypothetical protein [Gammaproteobacteria bacterium]